MRMQPPPPQRPVQTTPCRTTPCCAPLLRATERALRPPPSPCGREAGAKRVFVLPSMLPLLSSLREYFFPLARSALCHRASIGLAASCGVGTSRLQRPSLRVGAYTRHPMLSASLTSAGKPVGGDPISPTASSQARKCTGSPPPARTAMCPCAGRWRMPLCALPPRVTRQCPKTATGPSATCALPPPSPYASHASPRDQHGPCTSNAAHSQVDRAPHSTPTLWPSRARGGCPPW